MPAIADESMPPLNSVPLNNPILDRMAWCKAALNSTADVLTVEKPFVSADKESFSF